LHWHFGQGSFQDSQPAQKLFKSIYIIYFLGLLGRNRYKPCMARLSAEMRLGHSWGALGANGAFFINFWGKSLPGPSGCLSTAGNSNPVNFEFLGVYGSQLQIE
jgi:hypothetical protein